jgi:hypothetical protein
MKTYWGHKMEMRGQLHAPAALLPGKEHPVPIGQETGGGAQSRSGYNLA